MHAIGAAQYLHAFERLFNAFHPAVLRLLGLALTLVLFCHWLGCGWWQGCGAAYPRDPDEAQQPQEA